MRGGAVTRLAREFSKSRSFLQVRALANRIFPDLQPTETALLAHSAENSVLAADIIKRSDRDTAVANASIPVNGGLFDEEDEGNRFRYGVEVDFTNPDSGQEGSFLVWVEGADGMSLNELEALAEQAAFDIASWYPERVDNATMDLGDFAAGDIIMAERKY